VGLRFQHANGNAYGDVTRPPLETPSSGAMSRAVPVEVHANVRSALRHLGFRDAEARAVLDELQEKQGAGLPPLDTAEQLLRAALVRLGHVRRR
jgi:hypothetical protein